MYTKEEVYNIAKILGIDFCKFPFEEFYEGIKIELEHGFISPLTNVTNDNLMITAKIALAHLNEFPDYYNKDYGLPALERYLSVQKQMRLYK